MDEKLKAGGRRQHWLLLSCLRKLQAKWKEESVLCSYIGSGWFLLLATQRRLTDNSHLSVLLLMECCGKGNLGRGNINAEPPQQELQETQVWCLGRKYLLEGGMATHSSNLTWRLPWTEEPGGLQSTASQRVGHDWSNWAFRHEHKHKPSLPVWTVDSEAPKQPGEAQVSCWTLESSSPLHQRTSFVSRSTPLNLLQDIPADI